MKKIREEARKQRTKDVAIQSGIYLASFWFMHIADIVAMAIYHFAHKMPFNALIVAHIITGTQGMVLLGVYYGAKQRDPDKLLARNSAVAVTFDVDDKNETVSMIRAKAANHTQRPRLSILQPASFRIFDGTPAEDSPWAAFLEDDIESTVESINTRATEADGISGRTLVAENSDLSAMLLS